MTALDVFPVPRHTRRLDAEPAGEEAPVRVAADPALRPQGYRLTARDGGILLEHADEAGLRYGLDTLAQLRVGRVLGRTALCIEDWPDFAVRGFMLDISRSRVLHRRGLRRVVDMLVRARYNQLELYTEHTFAVAGHERVWEHASPMTAEDIRWLDDVCARAGIALVANQNCLGHMERWLEHPEYADRAELPGGIDLVSERLPATTLAPTPENARFVGQILEQLVPLTRTRRLNIGCDEPWELGRGHSRDRAEAEGLGAVYADYVGAVMRPWTDRGYQVEYWADVAGSHPDVLDRLPAQAVPVVWMYNSPEMMQQLVAQDDREEEAGHAAHGIVLRELTRGFRDRGAALIERGVPFWVAPGTNAWRSVTGRIDEAVRNLIDAAEVGLENGGGGYLVTTWGNQGAWDPPASWLAPLMFGGAVSWSLATNRDLDLVGVLNRHVLEDATGITGRVLVDVARVPELLERPILNTSPLWVVLQSGGALPAKQTPSPDRLDAVDELLARCADELEDAQPVAADAGDVLAEIRQVIAVARLGVRAIRAGLGADADPDPRAAARLLAETDRVLAGHAATWRLSSRHGGLAESIAQLDALRARLQRVAAAAPTRTVGAR